MSHAWSELVRIWATRWSSEPEFTARLLLGNSIDSGEVWRFYVGCELYCVLWSFIVHILKVLRRFLVPWRSPGGLVSQCRVQVETQVTWSRFTSVSGLHPASRNTPGKRLRSSWHHEVIILGWLKLCLVYGHEKKKKNMSLSGWSCLFGLNAVSSYFKILHIAKYN